MKKYAYAQLDGKEVTTSTVMVQLMRLHQITCGHFTADDGTVQEIPSRRVDELMDILDEVEGKAVIWSHYQKDVQRIIKEIKKKHGEGSVVDYYGLVINPNMLAGQVHGGIAQGIGQAIFENTVYDDENGQLLSGSFMDYALPRAEDLINVDIRWNIHQ